MSGITGNCDSIKGAIKFQVQVKIITEGGSVSAANNNISVNNADDATLYISIASGFKNYNDISDNAAERANAYLQNSLKKNYQQALKDHIADYQNYFNRVNLNLGVTDSVKNPTDIRIKQFAQGNDPQLAALYFQYGRYLLISSSRPGGQPANLQGIWNDQLYPPWDSKYTVNINTEMNYWPSEITNLSEMNEPLIQMTKDLSKTGRQTARDMYGARRLGTSPQYRYLANERTDRRIISGGCGRWEVHGFVNIYLKSMNTMAIKNISNLYIR